MSNILKTVTIHLQYSQDEINSHSYRVAQRRERDNTGSRLTNYNIHVNIRSTHARNRRQTTGLCCDDETQRFVRTVDGREAS